MLGLPNGDDFAFARNEGKAPRRHVQCMGGGFVSAEGAKIIGPQKGPSQKLSLKLSESV